MKSKVSVLVPVYNGEAYLSDCLDCLLEQTFEHWEAIIVNNASTDGTAEIIERFLQLDDRFRVVVNPVTVSVIENHNVAARHMSLEAAYCKIFHVDDWMAPNCLELMVALADDNPGVGIVGAWGEIGDRVEAKIAPYEQSVFSGAEIGKRSLLGEIRPFISPSVLMMRADVVRRRPVLYALDGLHADVDAAYSMLQECDYGCVQTQLFRIGRHENSMTASQAAPMNKNIAHNLELLIKYSPFFLSSLESRDRIEQVMDNYYLFLTKSLARRSPQGFWQYHRDALLALDSPLDWWRLAREAVLFYASHPRALVQMLKSRVRPGSFGLASVIQQKFQMKREIRYDDE